MTDVPTYEVFLTAEAETTYMNIQSESDLRAVDSVLDVLDTMPGIGRVYDPLYEANKPAIDNLLVAFAGHFGIYYVTEEDTRRVFVLALEDQRRNPLQRFAHLGNR